MDYFEVYTLPHVNGNYLLTVKLLYGMKTVFGKKDRNHIVDNLTSFSDDSVHFVFDKYKKFLTKSCDILGLCILWEVIIILF